MAQLTFKPDGTVVTVRPGTTVLDAARRGRVPVRTRCGGKAACLMCKVISESGAGLAPLTPNEKMKLGGLEEQGYRLACQAKIVGDAVVAVPEDPLKAAIRQQLARQREENENL